MKKGKNKYQHISANTDEVIVNNKVIKELKQLFEIAPPRYLRKSVMEIFFSYLCNTDVENYKPEIKEIATDFYFLIKFLEEAEKESRRSTT